MRVALRISAWGVLFSLSFLLAGLRPVLAQSDDERARTHFEAGRAYYEQAQYDDAAREFQESFNLSGRPELLLNLSQAHERALRYDDAIGAARRYLELAPKADNRKTVEDRIASLQQLKQRYEQNGPAPLAPPGSLDGVALAVPGGSVAGGAAAGGTAATPGSGQPASASLPPTAAGLGVSATAAPALATKPEPGADDLTIPAIVLMGTGGAALVAALVTGLVAHADYNSLERQCMGGACPPAAEDELDEGKTLSVVSTVLTFVGIAAAGTGVALLAVDANTDDTERRARLGAGMAVASPAGHFSFGPGPTPLSASGAVSF